jgi:hypothetical protein
MKDQTTNQIPQDLIDALCNLPVEQILIGQCASVCSCFITGAYITATSTELIEELVQRHKGQLDRESVESVIERVLNFGVAAGALTREFNELKQGGLWDEIGI